MISFNDLLRSEKLNPATVRLARHQDQRTRKSNPLYFFWEHDRAKFEQYQCIQSSPVFKEAKWIASFVVTPSGETLFVGLYAKRGVSKAPPGLIDPITNQDVEGYCLYDLTLDSKLAEYSGKVIVEWGPGYRAWVQRAHKQEKQVIEIRRSVVVRPFPGFLNFHERLSSLSTIPTSWHEALSSVAGVYLLVSPKTGKKYVGSAYGIAGFLGRWLQYAADGHGGNKMMQDVPRDDYWVSVLEVASSSDGPEDVIALENRWKEKLRSREFGLNGN